MKKYKLPQEKLDFFEHLRQPFAIYQLVDKRVVTLALSEGFCRLFGFEDREQAYRDMDSNMYRDTHPDDAARVANAALHFTEGSGRFDVIFRTRRRESPDYFVVHALGEHVYTDDGIRLAHVWYTDEGACAEDGGEQKTGIAEALNNALHELSLINASQYDFLTGLPSMTYFFELAEAGTDRIREKGGNPVVMYMDFRGMKFYNIKHGFAEGDRLLQSFAAILVKIFGNENSCRIGADHFAVLAQEAGLDSKLEQLFSEYRGLNEGTLLPVHVGVYVAQIEKIHISVACDRAKLACSALSGKYETAVNYYSRDLSDDAAKRQYIIENLDRAIKEKWIHVYYQPIVRAVNGKVCDEEALARWIDPLEGFLSPADFIPTLEEAGLIYKLDLYVLEHVLEEMKEQAAAGMSVVQHSINLSRYDFDACDIVEEIRRRVDASGIDRNKIIIEITESVIGSDFEFMKEQVERFRGLGFPVWMDDFGSGYSSLDVLQSIKFDLIKFDMSFMRKLDEGDSGKIILTEMMKMATSLGVDTVCEGVETEEQVHFLQEIGCSKLQGFYYGKAIPLEEIVKRIRKGVQIGYEKQEEAAYYEKISRINVYDLAVIANEDDTEFQNAFNTLPMGIMEIKDGKARYVRSSQSYRDFMMRFYDFDVRQQIVDFSASPFGFGSALIKTVRQCCDEGRGNRAFFDEIMPDGSKVHSFVRRIGVNPINGSIAVAIAVLSIREPDEGLMIEQILSVIEQFGEHLPGGFFIYRADESEELLYANREVCQIFGCDSLEDFKQYTGFSFRGMVHPEDYDRISESIKNQVSESQSDLDFVEYRIIRRDGEIRWIDDYGHYMEYDLSKGLYYVFISDITAKYQQAESDKALRSAVIEALTKVYDSVWLISDVQTQRFELYRIDPDMVHRMPANAASKLKKFSDAFAYYSNLVLEEDRQRFLDAVTPESIVKNTEERLIYSVPFRRVFETGIRYYRVEFARLDLPGGKIGIVTGFKNVDEEVQKELQIRQALREAINAVNNSGFSPSGSHSG